jgi:hypothetical protein
MAVTMTEIQLFRRVTTWQRLTLSSSSWLDSRWIGCNSLGELCCQEGRTGFDGLNVNNGHVRYGSSAEHRSVNKRPEVKVDSGPLLPVQRVCLKGLENIDADSSEARRLSVA